MKTKLFAPLLFIACALFLTGAGCPGLDPSYVPVTGVSLTPASATLPPGGTLNVKYTVFPYDATNSLGTLYVSDPTKVAIAVIDYFNFMVIIPPTATAGTVTITAITDVGKFKATCVITIDPAAPATKALTLPVITQPDDAAYRFGILNL